MKNIVALCGLVVAALLGMSGAAWAVAGTGTLTTIDQTPGQTVTTYTYTFTGASDTGVMPATSTSPHGIDGWIISVETNPGSTSPTAAYDITLLDADGVDVMAGGLADRSATLSEKVITPQPYVRGPVTITIGNTSAPSATTVIKITVLR